MRQSKTTKSGILRTPYELRVCVIHDPQSILDSQCFVYGGSVFAFVVCRDRFGAFAYFADPILVKVEYFEDWEWFVFQISRRRFRDQAKDLLRSKGVEVGWFRQSSVDVYLRTSPEYLRPRVRDVMNVLIELVQMDMKAPIKVEGYV